MFAFVKLALKNLYYYYKLTFFIIPFVTDLAHQLYISIQRMLV